MKISDVNKEGPAIQLIQQTQKLTRPEKTHPTPEEKPVPAEDTVNLSSEAREMKRIRDILETSPEVRTERVAALKKAIENGQYEIRNEAIAKGMVQEALQEFNK